MKTKETGSIFRQDKIADDIYSMWISSESIAKEAKPGQFVSLYCHEGSRLLPRPISICQIDRDNGRIRLVYRIAGEGTKEFSSYKKGDSIELVGPLGNGFPLAETQGKRVFLMGGGIGVPPMVETAKQVAGEAIVIAGYRDVCFLTEELSEHGQLYIATEDGSCGTPGNVLDAVRENGLSADAIFACGPKPMLRAIKTYAEEHHIPCWVSMEERMACGIGACLGCVCKTTSLDEHSQVNNKRICKDGPVFLSSEVEL